MLQAERDEQRRVGKLIDLDAIDDEEVQQARVYIKQEVVEEAAQKRKKAKDKIDAETQKAESAVVRPPCLPQMCSPGLFGARCTLEQQMMT